MKIKEFLTVPEKKQIETTTIFTPKFNDQGLIPAIAQDAHTNQILMLAYMNQQALAETIKTGHAIYYSRSRQKLWRKGEQSGHTQKVQQILTDCDQDTIILKVTVNAGQCHTGHHSCFYRRLQPNTNDQLEFIAQPTYNPKQVY